jgi:hypothetical protein
LADVGGEWERGVVCTYVKPEPWDCSWYVVVPLRYEYWWPPIPRYCEYDCSGEDDERLEAPSPRWAVAGSVAWASGGGESGGVAWWAYRRACSRAGGDESGGGPCDASGTLTGVAVAPRLAPPMAREMAERVELRRDPGDR